MRQFRLSLGEMSNRRILRSVGKTRLLGNGKENFMNRRILTSALAAFALLIGAACAAAQQFGTAAEAKAMLEKAVAAVKGNEADALAKFNSPTGGFRDRDLYVFCFDMTTGKFNAHVNPALMGTDARALKVKDQPVGQMVFAAAKEGTITTVDYDFPKPGTTEPVPKESYVTRVGNEGCGVGYYK
jgi:signal transduction histidine kinase